MRPKSKVSDWLAKKSEDGSDDGEQSSDEERSEGEKSASDQEEDGDTEDEDNREFDIGLVERRVLRSRPTERIQYMKNELHGRVSCRWLPNRVGICRTDVIRMPLALSPSDSRQVVYVLLEALLRHGDEKTHEAIVDVLLQVLRTSDMQVTEDLVAWVFDQTTSVASLAKTYVSAVFIEPVITLILSLQSRACCTAANHDLEPRHLYATRRLDRQQPVPLDTAVPVFVSQRNTCTRWNACCSRRRKEAESQAELAEGSGHPHSESGSKQLPTYSQHFRYRLRRIP